MMAIVYAAAGIICVGILGIGFLLGSYVICESLNSMDEEQEK